MNRFKKALKERELYIGLTLGLLALEVLIAVFPINAFIRNYVGDVLVVILLYTFVRCIFPAKIKLLPLYIFAFACLVEVLQYFDIVKVLGLADYTFFRILIGTTFDIRDIICYAVGFVILLFSGVIKQLCQK